jgi:hypothetical protein
MANPFGGGLFISIFFEALLPQKSISLPTGRQAFQSLLPHSLIHPSKSERKILVMHLTLLLLKSEFKDINNYS